eukprot:TRINITY_DN17203_c0_g1_i2.p1 TRINITY_DN17203_c0_g1~~TRINITY_DN17203_c0_g1_i2.p1  ORF type:complete len:623 (-),score=124.31 TRINITY_DN17203_c0_g1_i2:66-1934(-)
MHRRDPTLSKPLREANHYQTAEWIIKLITAESSTSYVEAVSVEAAAQTPAWFISHWWGEAVRDFVKSIAKHLDVRGLPPFETAYWVCAYAINQRELDLELAQDLVEMPFSRAMAKVKGVLLILDSKATSLSRAWCLLEVTMQGAGGCGRKLEPAGQEPSDTFLTSEPEKAESEPTQSTATPYPLLDLASVRTEVRGGTAELLTDGLTDVEMDWEEKHPGMGHIGKTDREQNFPLEVIEAGMRVDAAAAEATKPGDSARVFNALVGRSAEADGASLQAVNKHLHSVFARAGLSQALRRHAEMSAFLAALVADTTQQELRLPCLSHVLEDANAFVADLGRAVVALQELRRLELDFGWQSVHSDGLIGKLSDVDELGRGVGQLANLRHFTLRLSGCRKLADLTELGRGIGQLVNLTHLELLLIGCEGVRDIAELGRGVGHLVNLTHLDMVITGSKSLADIKDLGFSIRHLQSLVHLKLHVSGCPNLHYVVELGKSIRFLPNLKHLELDLSFCTHLKDIAHLGRSIRMLTEQWADFGQPKHGSVFTLNIEKSGLKIDRQGTTFFDEPKQFISALGRAAYDDAVEEAEDNPPVPLPRVPWKPDACSHEESEAIKREFRVPLGIQGNM